MRLSALRGQIGDVITAGKEVTGGLHSPPPFMGYSDNMHLERALT